MNDFAMHLIISNWLRRQKFRQKRRNNEKKINVETKEEITANVFSFILICNRSHKCLLFLLNSETAPIH